MDDLKKETEKKPFKKQIEKEPKKEYVIKASCLVGQKQKPLVKGEKVSLTKEQAKAYLKNNII